MIVCSCNVFSDKDVRNVLCNRDSSVRCVREVYNGLGCAPQCGRCASTIKSLIVEEEGRISSHHGMPREDTAALLTL
ncbi:(2Fe-2S)-binding protein [Terripilifer ovatus]|uniref:(2Fe-2S)-binding protein n=1 Tax=Terripilifer ovatus TaxID=3032367 RepID=UPI003AB9A2A5